uniref:7TM GPCR serpentine receptor class x (Srx) domain-containing protein n=1 Tax=Panagrolaimus sp. JU765 TaxID=591449 RepID=A0AC34R2T4_9BILA
MGITGFFIPVDAKDRDPRIVQVYKCLNWVTTLASNSTNCLFTLVFLERLMATILSKTYEKSHNLIFLIFGSCLCWIYGLVNVLCWNVFNIDVSILGPISFSVSAVDFICICILWIINKKSKQVRSSSSLILTKRYQIDENIRMTSYISPFMFFGTTFAVNAGITSGIIERALKVGWEYPCTGIIYFSLLNLMRNYLLFVIESYGNIYLLS